MLEVKIVTDSVADLPHEVAHKFGITVVPLNVLFGTEVYRDNIDLTADQFYERLKISEIFPTTSAPTPAAYVEVYDKLAVETDSILVITITSKLSGTYDVAVQSRNLMKKQCRVEVFDSQIATMAQGFIAIKAAEAAKAGASLEEVMEAARQAFQRVDFLCTFDTLEYLRRGGRIGAAAAFLGSMLKINPLITMKDGVVKPAGRTRSKAKAIDCLYEFVKSYSFIERLAVENTACPEEAEMLIQRLGALFPVENIYRSKMTPVIGTHTGPGLLLVSVLGDK
ncbi:MAG: DegV family protein [Spirochaetota bacterium]